METQLDLSIEFVSASQSGTSDVVSSGLVQTGDIVPMLIIFLTSILACCFLASFVCLRNKQNINIFRFGSNKNTAVFINPVKHVFKSIFGMCTLVVIACIVAAMLIVAALSTNFCTPAYAAGGGLTPSSNKIIGTVQDDGSVSFSTCNLTNSSDNLIKLKSASVEVAPEAKSIEALNSCVLAINAFDTCIYNGNPDGTEQTTLDSKSLEINEITPLSLDITNLDKQSTLDLCGKKVFKFKLTTIPITKYWLETDGNGLWKDGDLSINSIEVFAFEVPVIDGENLTYIRPDGSTYTVTAVAKDNYQFSTCNFDEATKTYCANYVLAQSYKDSLCTEIAAISDDLIVHIRSCENIPQDYINQRIQSISNKSQSVKGEIQGLNTKEDADAAVESAKSWFLDEAKTVFKYDLSECASSKIEDIEELQLLTNTYKTQVLSELSETSEEGVSRIDSQTSIADVYNVHNEYENKIKDYYNEANEFSIAKQAGLANVEASVAAANAQIDAAVASTYLKQDEATAYRTTISDAAAEGKPAIENADFPDDFQEVLNTYLGAINDAAEEATNLAMLRQNTIEASSAKANALLQTVINSNWFNQTYISGLSSTLNTKITNFKTTAMGTQNLDLINAEYRMLTNELDMMAADIKSLILAKESADMQVAEAANQANASINMLNYYSYTQKQALRNKIDTDKNTAHTNLINTTDEDEINIIAINFSVEVAALINNWFAFNQEKEDAAVALQEKFNDGLATIYEYGDFLSSYDIEYFTQNIEIAKSTLFEDICNIETSNALDAFVEAQNAMVDNCIEVAKERRDIKEAAQNDLTDAYDENIKIVEDEELELESDTEFYEDGINEVYEAFQGNIRDISPYDDEDDINECVEYGIAYMKEYSDAAAAIEDLRDEALEGVQSRQDDFNLEIDDIDGLTDADRIFIKDSFASVQQEYITDELNNMHFGWEIDDAESIVEYEAYDLKDDAEGVPWTRTNILGYVDTDHSNASVWIDEKLTHVTDEEKQKWETSLQQTSDTFKASINNDAHTIGMINELYNNYVIKINITLREAAIAQATGTKEWANSSKLYPLWQGGSGVLSTYEYNRLMAEIQNLITTFNTQIGQMGDPSNIMNSTSGVTDAIERYGENGDLKIITITSESQNISFVYGEGAYQVNAGQFIVLGFEGDGFRVKVNHVGGNEVVSIKDNLGNTYAVGEDGYFTFNVLTDITTITASETE